MPKIIDNEHLRLVDELRGTLEDSKRADFCVGYFNLRGWHELADMVEHLPGQSVFETEKGDDVEKQRICRLLVGMHKAPDDLLRDFFHEPESLSNKEAERLRQQMAVEFRRQLTVGYPTNRDEQYLLKLAEQIRSGILAVKLYLKNTLHAKLYLIHTTQRNAPIVGFVGSSNLTFSGLSAQGELNVDVVENDAALKLAHWFDEKWNDRWCIDISKEIVDAIENNSWVQVRPPYHVYLKIAYHLSQEARAGLNEFRLPKIFEQRLLPFQQHAVKIAAYHIHKRGGVIVGDVVGLGKTITAAAIARIFQEDYFYKVLIICPPNLMGMWAEYKQDYDLHADIISLGSVQTELKHLKRYKLIILDESHNLRNKEGKRYKAIREYIQENECKVLLLSATPYNKSYSDLANQLGLFIDPDDDLGLSPEVYIQSLGDINDFASRHPEVFARGLRAFELSPFSDDWRELLRNYMVRRTRSFIKNNYAETDPANQRRYLTFSDGTRSYFPDRIPRKVEYGFNLTDREDQYARLYSPAVVDILNSLNLPRYGLARYISEKSLGTASTQETLILENLSRAGGRLRGFCRTNLFKRLESSGSAFLLSISRHLLRNFVALSAIQQGLPIPIGSHIGNVLDDFIEDQDSDDNPDDQQEEQIAETLRADAYSRQAQKAYELFQSDKYANKFDWIAPEFFSKSLARDLEEDCRNLLSILDLARNWNPTEDRKLNALHQLLAESFPNEKVLIFSQFADTAYYLEEQLKARNLTNLAAVTAQSPDPSALAHRFSPRSNRKTELYSTRTELRILIATDVLSEGQNLQDAHIIVNYDLPWAIIRLIQRAGRVDRIGQQSDKILCYSFLPEDGIESIIQLRSRLSNRIQENAEVVGSDETFFDGDPINIQDIYSEKSGILDEVDDDLEVDLSSYAFQIWKNATDADPKLKQIIPELPNVSYSTKAAQVEDPTKGVVVYARTSRDIEHDVLLWLDNEGKLVTQSPFRILRAAACEADTPALPRQEHHHELVRQGIELLREEDHKSPAGTLGKRTGTKYKVFNRLTMYREKAEHTLFQAPPDLNKALDDIFRFPLREYAKETLNRQYKLVNDEQFAELTLSLWEQNKLVVRDDTEASSNEAQIICSLGLV
jgi:superfamily II DNA or RNA helicase